MAEGSHDNKAADRELENKNNAAREVRICMGGEEELGVGENVSHHELKRILNESSITLRSPNDTCAKGADFVPR